MGRYILNQNGDCSAKETGNYLYLYDSSTGIQSFEMDGYTQIADLKFQ